jgi:hypothetical protein
MPRKHECVRHVKGLGYTEEYHVGEPNPRKRLWFRRPGVAIDPAGDPVEFATVSRTGREWFVNEFDSSEDEAS